MALKLYWWSPARSARALAVEARHHLPAWSYVVRRSGPRLTNFGDEVSRAVVAELSGQSVRWSSLRNADVAAVGSLLNAVAKAGVAPLIFGSGVRDAADLVGSIDTSRVLAVRGKLTRDALGLPADTPLGDPGLIVRELLAARAGARDAAGLLIPHFSVSQTARGRQMLAAARAAGWKIVFPNEKPLDIAEAIRKAPVVITSSLHAMVFAHSVGTPVSLVTFDESGPSEPAFKYEDYLSVFGRSPAVSTVAERMGQTVHQIIESVEVETAEVAGQIDERIASIYRAAAPLRAAAR